MTDYVDDGFEDQTFDAWGYGDGTIQSTVKNTGSYAALFTDGQIVSLGNTEALLYISGSFRLSAVPDDYTFVDVIRILDASYDIIASVTIEVYDGIKYLTLYQKYPSEAWNSYAFASLAANTFFNLKLKFAKDNFAGEYRVYLDNVEVITLTGLNTGSLANAIIYMGQPYSTYTTNVYLDDAKISDADSNPPSGITVAYSSTPVSAALTLGSLVVQSGQSVNIPVGTTTFSVPAEVEV
jgi:hypothetical protein